MELSSGKGESKMLKISCFDLLNDIAYNLYIAEKITHSEIVVT